MIRLNDDGEMQKAWGRSEETRGMNSPEEVITGMGLAGKTRVC